MILSGKPLAQDIMGRLKLQKKPSGKFIVVQVGSDAASNLYIEKKSVLAGQVGIDLEVVKLNSKITPEKLHRVIAMLNRRSDVRAILMQMPLPDHIDRLQAAGFINPQKDVDGFGYILSKATKPIPPTVRAIVDLLKYYNISLRSKNILIIGQGFLVGKPLFRYWNEQGLNVAVLGKSDPNYNKKIKSADIVVAATGKGGVFTYSDFKIGATVIDASTICENAQTRGDVILSGWKEDKNLAPVPGGVGPVTVAELLRNFFIL